MTGGNDFSDRMCHFVTFIDTTLIAQTKNVLSAAINVNYFILKAMVFTPYFMEILSYIKLDWPFSGP